MNGFQANLRSAVRTSRTVIALTLIGIAASVATAAPPAPTDVEAQDVAGDGGGSALVRWTTPAETEGITGYQVWRSETAKETGDREATERADALAAAQTEAFENEQRRLVDVEGLSPEAAAPQSRAVARQAAISLARDPAALTVTETGPHGTHWILVDTVSPAKSSLEVSKLDPDASYTFIVYSVGPGPDGRPERSEASAPSGAVIPSAAVLNLFRLPLLIILLALCGVVLLFILLARRGMPLKIRTIAGLAAVDEAVGRATEMGRPMLYINGIQDMDDLQTVAGVTVLGRVAKTAAEYDARIEVPTSRSLVMSAARETVQASYLTAGRSDSYNPDLIYYVTDEQFGFTAYVSGLIVRDRPAACFYMGAFFAESLILAETGNSVGAIQIAGTAMPSQLPFFVAACDYTLIGEEFFAASAYLSGQPDQLGSLKGQDLGKILVGVALIVLVTLATIAAITGSTEIESMVSFIKTVILGG